MKFTPFKEPIVRHLLLLLTVFLFLLIGLGLLQRQMSREVFFLQSLVKNESVKVELSYLSYSRLLTTQRLFQDIALAHTERELQNFTKKINHEIEDLIEYLSILNKGGSITHSYLINSKDTGQLTRTFIYKNYYPNHINLEILELRAKLFELPGYISLFWQVMSETIQQDIYRDVQGLESTTNERLQNIYKKITPLFNHMQENSYRIYFDAQNDFKELQLLKNNRQHSAQLQQLLFRVIAGMIILSLGWLIIRNSNAIILERNSIQNNLRQQSLDLEKEIAQREAVQLQLKDSEKYYRTLIEASHDLSMIINQTGIVTYASSSAQNILGYPPEQIIGTNLFEYLHKDDVRISKKRFENFILSLQSEKHLIFRIRSSEGSYKVLEASVKNLLAEPTIQGLLLYARDITAKQAAEEQLRKLQLVVEQNPSSIVITDLDGTIQYVNKQFEKVTGYTKEEALGQNPNILNSGLTPPEVFVDMWETLQHDEIWNGEFINRSKSGKTYHENVILAPLKNDKGEVTHYVAVKENITELKQAREAAEASNKAKSDFLSRMSHELRTPLNAINGFSEILLRKNKQHPLDERQNEQVTQINTAGKHLLELINEILDLSRIESGQIAVSIKPVIVSDMVTDCMALVGPLAQKTGISIEVDKSIYQLPSILADTTRIKQVLLNLLSNAVKYNRPQGTVSIAGKLDGNIVSLLVKDSGIGISEKQLDELFVPFTRLGQDKSDIEGTGIGMTITKQLVELMKGSLRVESEVGIGSTFIVRLPLAEKVIIQKSQSSETPQDQNSLSEIKKIKGTVIYIEDDPGSVQLMRGIVEQWPEVALVVRKNAEKGVKAITMLQPDLVFMDLQLPGMSGKEAFSELQNNPKTRDITVLALSGDASPETIKEYLALGFAEYLTKPITTEQLSKTLEEYWPS